MFVSTLTTILITITMILSTSLFFSFSSFSVHQHSSPHFPTCVSHDPPPPIIILYLLPLLHLPSLSSLKNDNDINKKRALQSQDQQQQFSFTIHKIKEINYGTLLHESGVSTERSRCVAGILNRNYASEIEHGVSPRGFSSAKGVTSL